ncbi:MAG: cyclase family protein [Vicinamibacterales bacterium]
MKLIDITVPLDSRLATYPGNPPFSLHPVKRIAEGGSSNVSSIRMSVHAGTHVDAPRHFFDDGGGAESLPLELLCGRTRVVELTTRRAITAEDLAGLDLREDIRLLLKTHNSRLWAFPDFQADFIGVTENGARYLVDRGVKVLGVDYLSIEDYKTPGAPAHRVLLRAGTVIIEGLNLRDVEPGSYEMFCLPLPVVGGDAAPARVILRRS